MSHSNNQASSSSDPNAYRQFISRFRFSDNFLATFTDEERKHITDLQKFVNQMPDGFCCVCLRVLYPQERRYRTIENLENLKNCTAWKLKPLTSSKKGQGDLYMVCTNHQKTKEEEFPTYIYPGDLVKEAQHLNYRERGVLSPIKLMTQMTRKSTILNGRIGHYELSGGVNLKHNFEFAEMAYGGTLGLFFQRGDPENIRKRKVTEAYAALQAVHPLLARYDLQPLMHSLVNYHIKEYSEYIGVRGRRNGEVQWPNNILFSEDTVHPQASEANFHDIYIGTDQNGSGVRFRHPSLLALLFPYLYTNCTGHYSMAAPTPEDQSLPENRGGLAVATRVGETLKGYARQRLIMKDRRFAQDQSFLFFMLDAVEKNNINAANKFVVSTTGRGILKQKDVYDNITKSYNKAIVSRVPYTVRSSYAYKRRNYLNLQTVFRHLGAPQLFLTFSCNDYSEDFKSATGTEYPWQDPVLFSNHFKRRWNHFFSIIILGYFAEKIGGIKDYSWVMEIQDRGSPHIHCVLWTEASVEQLIAQNVVVCRKIPKKAHQDPLLYRLVEEHQTHKCNPVYCKLRENQGCRFKYPKPATPRTEFIGDSCIYERGVEDAYVNNYNPFLLAVWRANMDIQYNRGKAAVRYLAKYMAKNESDTMFEIINKSTSGNSYKVKQDKTPQDHYKSRIVGAVEASYDLMGWSKHFTSRSVTFLKTNISSQDDHKALKMNINVINSESTKIFARTQVEKYEERTGARGLSMIEFFSYYREKTTYDRIPEYGNGGIHSRPFYSRGRLPKYVKSKSTTYILRSEKEAFCRWYPMKELDGEKYYYQQIVLKKVLFNTTFENEKGKERSWRDFYEYLISIPEEQGGISGPERTFDITQLDDISDAERGHQAAASELRVMLENANSSQKAIFNDVLAELETNTTAFVSGAAGTGKSYLLKMFERHFKVNQYKVFKLAPTGVAAHNIGGMTIHKLFGMKTSKDDYPNHMQIDKLVKLYPRMLLLIDEYSMLSTEMLVILNDTLIKATNRNVAMGGIKTLFFGDLAQLLPAGNQETPIWHSGVFKHSPKYTLSLPIRQLEADFVDILNKVRTCNFDEDVIRFINKRTIKKEEIPSKCLRLYTTRKMVRTANTKDFDSMEGEPIHILAHDSYNSEQMRAAATRALTETRLEQELKLKIGMPVMLIQNLHVSFGWVNGSLVRVKDYDEDNILLSKIGGANGEESTLWIQRITRDVPGTSFLRTQFPIIPAFASTIHKAQGLTIDSVAIHLDNMLTHGQLYVAMSRVRRSDDLFFFGAELPLRIKRKFGLNLDAIDIVEFAEKRLKR